MQSLKEFSGPLAHWPGRAVASFKRRKYVWLLILIFTLLYSAISILRHLHFTSSAFDLSIFDQMIWRYSRFEPPYSTVRTNLLTENLLGDHFHPILITLAPLFWLVNRVETLLVAQAFLFALAIHPIFLFTEKRLGRTAAYLFSISYALFWGVQKAIEFDFHEIAFAVPLIAFAVYLMDEKRWRPYFLCVALLLLTKEDQSTLVASFGLLLLLKKQFKEGLISIALGITWFFLALKIFIPYFGGPGNSYHYWGYHQFGPDSLSAIKTALKEPLLVIKVMLSPSIKMGTAWHIFQPFLLLALFSPLSILMLPLLAARFLSSNASYWTTNYHYNATIAPLVVMASADGLFRLTRSLASLKERRTVIILASLLVLLLNIRLLPQYPLWQLTRPAYWRLDRSDLVGNEALSLIPPDASVTAQLTISPHLSHRRIIYTLSPHVHIPDSDYIIACDHLNIYPFHDFQELKLYLDIQENSRGYRRIFERDGWLILKRVAPADTPPPIYNFGVPVEQSVPDTMLAGRQYEVSIKMRNTGLFSWTRARLYRLGTVNGSLAWGITRVELPRPAVAPGEEVTFKFNVTAPLEPGQYDFQWGVVEEGVGYLGDRSPNVSVKVTPP